MSDFDSISTPDRIIIHFGRFNVPEVHRLGRYMYKRAHKSLPEHAHHGMMEICYCEKGQQVYEVNGRSYTIKGGDVFITFPGELHSTARHPEEKGILYWLILKTGNGSNFLHYKNKDASAFVHTLLNLPVRHFKGSAGMKKILDELFALHNAPSQPMNRVLLLNQLTNFLLAIVRQANKGAEPGPSNRKTELGSYIAANLYNDLSVELLASRMHLSASHFKSWFRHEFGMPPAEYVLRLRIEEAKKLLQIKQAPSIADAAYRLNFSSSQYFSTVFKKYTGITPGAYRSTPAVSS